METDDLLLGKSTVYPKSFSRDVLSRIPRADARAKLTESGQTLDFDGYDLWTLYELSWISTSGCPSTVVGEIRVPAESEFIVESKSLKLYINSLYYRRFDSADQVRDEISQALLTLLEAQVVVHLWPLSDFGVKVSENDKFINLDQRGTCLSQGWGADSLIGEKISGYSKIYKTDCFRSQCPVTGQPDWASVYIGVAGVKLDEESLATYLYGFAEHQGFHESCVEQIYVDIQRELEPDVLTVAARFTRRGGIDINPYRTSDKPLFPIPPRTVRQ